MVDGFMFFELVTFFTQNYYAFHMWLISFIK